jgi:Divergent InlB B-repeat domain
MLTPSIERWRGSDWGHAALILILIGASSGVSLAATFDALGINPERIAVGRKSKVRFTAHVTPPDPRCKTLLVQWLPGGIAGPVRARLRRAGNTHTARLRLREYRPRALHFAVQLRCGPNVEMMSPPVSLVVAREDVTVARIEPLNAASGTTVEIIGANFVVGSRVEMAGVSLLATYLSESRLRMTVPFAYDGGRLVALPAAQTPMRLNGVAHEALSLSVIAPTPSPHPAGAILAGAISLSLSGVSELTDLARATAIELDGTATELERDLLTSVIAAQEQSASLLRAVIEPLPSLLPEDALAAVESALATRMFEADNAARSRGGGGGAGDAWIDARLGWVRVARTISIIADTIELLCITATKYPAICATTKFKGIRLPNTLQSLLRITAVIDDLTIALAGRIDALLIGVSGNVPPAAKQPTRIQIEASRNPRLRLGAWIATSRAVNASELVETLLALGLSRPALRRLRTSSANLDPAVLRLVQKLDELLALLDKLSFFGGPEVDFRIAGTEPVVRSITFSRVTAFCLPQGEGVEVRRDGVVEPFIVDRTSSSVDCTVRLDFFLSAPVDEAEAVVAIHFPPPSLLDLRVDGVGEIQVTSPKGALDDACSLCLPDLPFDADDTVTLAALPPDDGSWVFAEWQGDCGGHACTVSMASDRSVTARFTQCGNKRLDDSAEEECDATAVGGDENCPGRCGTVASSAECRCVPSQCGNEVLEVGEQCDASAPMGDALCPGGCGAVGTRNECTCFCVVADFCPLTFGCPSSACESPKCAHLTNGSLGCIEGETLCATAAACDTDANCGPGEACVKDGACCGADGGVCARICPVNPGLDALSPVERMDVRGVTMGGIEMCE